ncbi:anaphase-promoting complex subunit 5 isoform X2 [Rhinatrema bivittatum]|uniref:anaphase-promoting complex subunit 5 isoform X2 n=1 Tax=Rhinatrema bivittatum TaxID=194408 RepID=UPI00112765DB|nr:anaphase-promoting complex subunit 5 isoform X2 [Rhinatrema bivittatum]
MASVHESLYFNPMMTNGVVHANVFGIKDWVTPYKISVLVLLRDMTKCPQISLMEKRRLNKLILPLLQGPDMTLSRLIKAVDECCPSLANLVKIRIKLMAEGELKDMEQFFDDLGDSFTGTEPEVHKTSVVGLFLRHMILAYSKLSFSQVYKLYTALQHYVQTEKTAPSASAAGNEEADMDLTNTEDTDGRMGKEELDLPLSEEEMTCAGPLSQKQAEYFLSQQASLLKSDENKALPPASLQKELNNLLKFNPDFAEAHYLSYLNSLRVQDVFSSTHSLLHYFDRLILTGAESKSNGEDGYGRSLRYAALNLAALHCRFGHYQQAELALQEAIRIAQESNDHVCLQHCLSWLYILEQKKGSESCVLLEHVKKTVHFGLPGCFAAASEVLKHLKERFPPNSQHAKLWMLFDQKIQFDKAMNDGKYHVAESLVAGIAALNSTEGLYRKAIVLKAQNQTSEAHRILQILLTHCQKVKNTEMIIRVLVSIAQLYWRSSGHTIALPVLLQALALSREYRLQSLASENLLNLAFSQLILGIPEQALNILHMAIEPILAHGSVLDKGRAMFLVAKCQVASAASYTPQKKAEALESAILNLNESRSYFGKVDCKGQIRDILYFQARLFNSLGKTQERNQCAMLFRRLQQELPSHGVSLINCL